MASSSEESNPDGGRLEVADPDDYNQARRLRQIHTARERVENAILDGFEDVAEGTREVENYDEYVAETLLLYLAQVEPLLMSTTVLGDGNGKIPRREGRFWHKIELPPEDEDDESEKLVELVETGEFGELTLEEILETDASPGDGDEVLTVSESRKAYRLVNRFLKEIGFGLDFNEPMPGHPSIEDEANYL